MSFSYFYTSKKLLWAIMGIGLMLHLSAYLVGESLWLDEASVALNVVNRSYSELLQPLDYDQGAPLGFLMVEKFLVQSFGNNEYALRLFPALAGIVSIILFFNVAGHYIEPRAIPIALGLFVISIPFLRYSTTVKQYSSDVAIGLLLYLVTIYFQAKEFKLIRLIIFGLVGAVAIWFSHPAIFILAGIGGTLMLCSFIRRDWTTMFWLSWVGLVWILSFVAAYVLLLNELSNNESLLAYWTGAFMPFPPRSLSDVRWYLNAFFKIFENPAGLKLTGLAAFAFLVGGYAMFFQKRERFFLLISPILLVLVASGFHQYPFSGRLLMFAVPAVLFLIAMGINEVRKSVRLGSTAIVIILTGLLFIHPLQALVNYFETLDSAGEIQPALNYVRAHQRNGDILYVYYGAEIVLKYYQEKYGYHDGDYIVGVDSRNNWKNYIEDLDKLRGHNRVWILFSHVYNWKDIDEEKFFLYYLDSIGKRRDFFKNDEAAVYLYDLSGEDKLHLTSLQGVHPSVQARP